MRNIIWMTLVALAVAGCSEKPQMLQAGRTDTSAYTGTGKAFVSKDWKPGDKLSWESHLKARSQYGQNDYTRMN